MHSQKTKVLILGGGFGGLKAALELSGHDHFDIDIISDQTSFRYYPTLYQAAIGGSPLASSIPLTEIISGTNIRLHKDRAEKLNRDEKVVVGGSGHEYRYDVLITALGVVTNFFDIPGLQKYAFGIKSIDEANRLHQHIHDLIVDEGEPDLNYVVVGGGPTGVELAGALPSYIHHIMARHDIKPKKIHVDIVEAAPRLMPRMPKKYSRAVQKHLRKLGVELYLGVKVEAATADKIVVSGHNIESHTVIWTAGVTNHPFMKQNAYNLTDSGRAVVDDYLQTEDNIYVLGDNANTEYAGLAQTAFYDALFVTGNLKRLAKGKAPKAYRPKKPVYVTPAGPYWAAALWGDLLITGRLGWLLRKAADLLAYHDLEPWPKALRHWRESGTAQEQCAICARRLNIG